MYEKVDSSLMLQKKGKTLSKFQNKFWNEICCYELKEKSPKAKIHINEVIKSKCKYIEAGTYYRNICYGIVFDQNGIIESIKWSYFI